MAVPLYSTRFLNSHDGLGLDYEVPAGYRAVLRFLTAFNASGIAPESAQLILVDFSLTLWQDLVPPSESAFLPCRIVIYAGETIHLNLDPDIDFTANGYLLTAP